MMLKANVNDIGRFQNQSPLAQIDYEAMLQMMEDKVTKADLKY
jgi:hypothetical protein